MTDLLVNFVLAFNLHFVKVGDNFIMKAIGERRTVKVLTEKMLLLFNRDGKGLIIFSTLYQICLGDQGVSIHRGTG